MPRAKGGAKKKPPSPDVRAAESARLRALRAGRAVVGLEPDADISVAVITESKADAASSALLREEDAALLALALSADRLEPSSVATPAAGGGRACTCMHGCCCGRGASPRGVHCLHVHVVRTGGPPSGQAPVFGCAGRGCARLPRSAPPASKRRAQACTIATIELPITWTAHCELRVRPKQRSKSASQAS